MDEKKQITRREALKRIAKIGIAASIANAIPTQLLGKEREGGPNPGMVAYSSFICINQLFVTTYSLHNSHR